MSKMKKSVWIALVPTIFLTASCSVVRSFVPIDEIIATDFAVTEEWKEIRPSSPMTSSHQTQMIMVKVDGAKLPESITDRAANTSKTDWDALAFPDGKLARPELQLIDETGVAHSLHGSSEGAYGRGYSVAGGSSNTSEKTYVALKIRSNIPFRAKEIKWYTYDRK